MQNLSVKIKEERMELLFVSIYLRLSIEKGKRRKDPKYEIKNKRK